MRLKIAFICVLLISQKANAIVASPYIGASISKYKVDMSTTNGIDYKGLIPASYTGYGLLFGLDLYENFGLEFGYDTTKQVNQQTGGAYGIDSLNSRLTFLRYDALVKVDLTHNTKLVGIIGLVHGINSVNISGNSIDGKFKQGGFSTGYEYGGGIWKTYDDRVFGKLEFRRKIIEFGGIANHVSAVSLGISIKL